MSVLPKRRAGVQATWPPFAMARFDLYQCVVPTTWNAEPAQSQRADGAYEAALMNTKMAIPEQPLEILRTLHSFDPCLACSTHVLGDDGSKLNLRRWVDGEGEWSATESDNVVSHYVFEAPVRIWHWLTVLCMAVLMVAGYFIGKPLPSLSGEATYLFYMGYIRLIHFSTGMVFPVVLLMLNTGLLLAIDTPASCLSCGMA